MKKGLVLGILVVLIFILSFLSAQAITGVKICGEDFNCGNNDGVCPTAYGGGTCSPCDVDCGSCGCTNGNTRSISCGTGACANTIIQTCVGSVWTGTCTPLSPSAEICSGGIDEDCDNLIDCDDSQCSGNPSCPTTFYWCSSGSCSSASYTDLNACETLHPSGCFDSLTECANNCVVNCGTCTNCNCCGGSAINKYCGNLGILGYKFGPTTDSCNNDYADIRFFCSSDGWYVCDPDEKATTTWSWFSNLKDATDDELVDEKYCCYDSLTKGHWNDFPCDMPVYMNDCDSSDGIGGTRLTAPYNSCDLSANVSCSNEQGKCDDGIDNDCDGLIDCHDFDCPEGSGDRENCCVNGINDDNDGVGLVLIDSDDPDCCDFCTSTETGNPFTGWDTSGGVCVVPGSDLSDSSWEPTPVKAYCCGDDVGEFFVSSSIGGVDYFACCDGFGDCVDEGGVCRVGYEDTPVLCFDGIDNDCDGLIDADETLPLVDNACYGVIKGNVTDQYGFPMAGVLIRGSPPGLGDEYESSSYTDINGEYRIENTVVGEYIFRASKESFDDTGRTVTIISKVTQNTFNGNINGVDYVNGEAIVDFLLGEGSCHEDCTDWRGNCNPSCEGSDGCVFIHTLCYNRPLGFKATKIVNNTIYEYTCCEGPIRTYPKITPTISGAMDQLYDYTFNAKLGDKFVKVHLLMFKEEKN